MSEMGYPLPLQSVLSGNHRGMGKWTWSDIVKSHSDVSRLSVAQSRLTSRVSSSLCPTPLPQGLGKHQHMVHAQSCLLNERVKCWGSLTVTFLNIGRISDKAGTWWNATHDKKGKDGSLENSKGMTIKFDEKPGAPKSTTAITESGHCRVWQGKCLWLNF